MTSVESVRRLLLISNSTVYGGGYLEETGLTVEALSQFHTYSDPRRDPRQHTISTVFTAKAKGKPRPADDAARAGIFTEETLPSPLAFDHQRILEDYFAARSKQEYSPQSTQRSPRTIKNEIPLKKIL